VGRLLTILGRRRSGGAPFTPASLPAGTRWWSPSREYVTTDAAADLVAASAQNFTRANEAAIQPGASYYVAGWAYWDAITPGGDVLWTKDGFAGTFIYVYGAGPYAITAGPTLSVTTGAWHFVEHWRDDATGKSYLSLNGGAAAELVIAAPTPGAGPMSFGAYADSSAPTDGKMQCWCLLPRRIATPEERAALWNGGNGVAYDDLPASLLAEAPDDFHWWPLCQATGARDDAHGAAHLTAVNAPGVAAGKVEMLAYDRAPVKRWENRLGAAMNGTQTDITKQPLWIEDFVNGRPALFGDGVDDRLDLTVPDPPTSTFGALVQTADDGVASRYPLHLTRRQIIGTAVNNDSWGAYNGQEVSADFDLDDDAPHALVMVTRAFDDVDFQTDDEAVVNKTNGTMFHDRGALGSLFDSSSGGTPAGQRMAGYLGHVVLVEEAIEEDDREALSAWLMAEWGL
jgi:hypothetical protein